jgi:hypothetical protein
VENDEAPLRSNDRFLGRRYLDRGDRDNNAFDHGQGRHVTRFIKFTEPGGGSVWIASQWVTKVQLPIRGQYPINTKTVIAIGATTQAVVQSPEEVLKLLEVPE